ncbi:hypothetical protein [Actinomarinicola tropica]|uniref:Uncharacterized protein n=1 Tax=Actinomarinicola tropica TaxID=2789776 RepID=A0A5Q2RNC0_9ACTN|nr:hypothetical protein [Actinomarinicola tropica]QGG96442.1 hypothetical protein GH723_15775 [Actinomarinicola tropica]
MSIDAIGSGDAATPRTQSLFDLVPLRVAAPRHPLADVHGQVPIEVFEVPPELLDVVRTLPIRGPEDIAAPPELAATGTEAPASRLVSEERRGTRIDLQA